MLHNTSGTGLRFLNIELNFGKILFMDEILKKLSTQCRHTQCSM